MTKQELIDLRENVSMREVDVDHELNLLVRDMLVANPLMPALQAAAQAWLDTEMERLELVKKRRRMELETAMFLLEHEASL